MKKERFTFKIGQDICYMMTKYSYLRVKPDGSYSHEQTKAYERDRNNWPAPVLASKSTVIKTVIELGLKVTAAVDWVVIGGENIKKQPQNVSDLLDLANRYSRERMKENGKYIDWFWICGQPFSDIDELPRLIAIIQKSTHQPI